MPKNVNANTSDKKQTDKKHSSEGLIIVDADKEEILDGDTLFGRGKLKDCDFAEYTRQLSRFLGAGIGVINSLKMMEEQIDNKKMKNTISYLTDQISEGNSLALSMAYADVFPEAMISVIESGENTGRLRECLDGLTVYYEKRIHREESIKKAFWYPSFIMVAILAILAGVLVFVVPGFVGMLDGIEINFPFSSRLVFGISDLLRQRWWLLLIIAAVIIVLCIFIFRSKSGRIFKSRFRLNYPGLWNRRIDSDCAEFSRIMSTMLWAGIPIARALELASYSFPEHVLFRKGIMKIKNQLSAGGSLSNHLADAGIFPKLLINMISIGEESGNLKEMFENAAEYYETDFENAARKSSVLNELVMFIILAIILGTVVMALLRPLLILFEAVGSM